MSRFVPAGTVEFSKARVLILGEPGVGKTRLAATFPNPVFINLEPGGADTALPTPPPRIDVEISPRTLHDVLEILRSVKAGNDSATIQVAAGRTIPVETIVVDSLDAIQLAVKTFEILKGRSKMERADWGVLLEKMIPLSMEFARVPANLVVVSHVKRRERGDRSEIEDAGLAVKGALKEELPGWFSHILHIVAGDNGKRFVITQPMISRNIRYLAKDRHNTLACLVEGKYIPLPADENGYPSNRIAQAICTPVTKEEEDD